MKKLTVATAGFVFAATLGMSISAVAETFSDCKTQASIARYDVETECYQAYGPQSGKWSATERSSLDLCLGSVGKQFSTNIAECQEMYMAAGDSRPPFENRESAVAAAVSFVVGLMWFLAI